MNSPLLNQLLYRELAAGIQVYHVLAGLAGVLVIMAIWNAISRATTLKSANKHLVQKACGACGWTGRTGAHVRQCPRCNKPL